MDILLLVITVVSLVAAGIATLVAWRLSREANARAAARVAALAAAAHADHPVEHTVVNEPTSFAVRPPLWSAPIERPSLEHEEFPRELVVDPPRMTKPASSAVLGESFLGGTVGAPPSGGRQRGLAIAAGVLFVAIVAGGYFSLFGHDTAGTAGVTASASSSPLELVSLRHERQNGGLAITGLVRNPIAGRSVDKLAAVVLLFDQQGSFLTSSRAGVDYTQLAPGDESPFVVRVQAPANVARYRVSFRTDAGVVPHVDRRGQEPIARDLP